MSVSENNKNIQNNDQPRKRGRPRKNQIIEKQVVKTSEKQSMNFDEQRQLILHLPIHLTSGDKKATESDNEFTIAVNNDKNNTTLTLSNSENSGESESSSNSPNNNYQLNEELKAKEKLIKKLKDEITDYKSLLSEYNVAATNDNKKIPMNLEFFDIKNGKQILREKTDIACWWCTHNFDTCPCFIPERLYEGKYYVFGCFCSYNCAAAYNLDIQDYKVGDRYALIKKLYSTVYNSNNDITIAPPREVLKKYGGILTIDEFRKNSLLANKEYMLVIPPFGYMVSVIEEKQKDKGVYKNNLQVSNEKNTEKQNVKASLFDTMMIREKK
jgi:hypothetical protein